MLPGVELRAVMRRWTSGVAVVSGCYGGQCHGMTVNSFTSVSLNPPIVSITLANDTRTHELVSKSGIFGVSLLRADQENLARRFAGQMPEFLDRFEGLEIIYLVNRVPVLAAGGANLDCQVVFSYPLPNSTIFLGEVKSARLAENPFEPLIYHNREYRQLR